MLERVKQCIDYDMLYGLEESLNLVGLTIQTTPQNRMVLCKLAKGRPVLTKICEDYMFVGGPALQGEISPRAMEILVDFIKANAGAAGKLVQPESKSWLNNSHLYGSFIANEAVDDVVQGMQ